MAEQKKPRGRKKKADVIDIGDKPAKESSDENDGDSERDDDADEKESGDDEGLDADLVNQAAMAVGTEDEPEVLDDVEVPEPKVSNRGGSLARRDPMAAYMAEARRYPLLTPEEEHDLAVKLVEHGDTAAARKLIEANL
ncbi:MAG TPA: sigma-70 factor domain-containing protein, partial [Kofleriaceae bacterium]|nr:sigma-70 factor domain-containing protein [Kofleriaceae bacterium]